LDKLRLRDKRRLQPEVRIRVLRHQRILLPQRSSPLRRDSKHLQRIYRRDSNRRHRPGSPVRQDNLQPPLNLERLAP